MNIIFFNTIALGDYLVHSKIIKNLKVKLNCHITAVCSPYNSKIISKHTHIDKIIIYNKDWSLKEKINCLKEILKKKYYLSIVFDCQKFSMLCNFLIKSKYKRGPLMKKNKSFLFFNLNFYYPSKLLAFFLYDKHVIQTRYKYLKQPYHFPSTWIDLLKDFNHNVSKSDIYYFNPEKIENNNKNLILNKLNVENYILIHFDYKWIDVLDIKKDLVNCLIELNRRTKNSIIITSYNNNFDYYKILEEKFNLYDVSSNKILKKNDLNIFVVKNPNVFLQERLISSSRCNISCHSGIIVHSAGANKAKLIDVLNENEIIIQKCWAPLFNYHVVKKSSNTSKIKISEIFEKIANLI